MVGSTMTMEVETMEVEENKCLINRLPDELLILCLQYLDADHLLHEVPQVCSRWNKLARDKYMWKQKCLCFDGSQRNDEAYAQDFIRTLGEVPYLGVLNLWEVQVKICDVASGDEMQPRMTHVTHLPNESGAAFTRSIGLASLKSNAFLKGLPDLLRSNRETLVSVSLYDVQLDYPLHEADFGQFYEFENIRTALMNVMEALQGCKYLRHLSLTFSEVWDYGVYEEFYKEMDRIVYSSVLQISSLRRLELICARPLPLTGAVPSPPCTGSWGLEELEITRESHFDDTLSALMVSAATGTLKVFSSDGGPRTAMALGQCQNLKVLELQSLNDIHFLKNLKNVDSLKIFSLRKAYNKNVTVQFILESPFLKKLKKLSLEFCSECDVDVVLAIITQCQSVKRLIISEMIASMGFFFHPLCPQPFIALAPLIVKAIVDGAMPELCSFDVHSGAHYEEWKEPLRALKEHRPKLHVLSYGRQMQESKKL